MGKIAYEAYCAARGWKSVRGEPLPQYEAQEQGIRDAWEAVAKAVADKIRMDTSFG